MRSLFPVLLLIAGLALVGTAAATSNTFQDGIGTYTPTTIYTTGYSDTFGIIGATGIGQYAGNTVPEYSSYASWTSAYSPVSGKNPVSFYVVDDGTHSMSIAAASFNAVLSGPVDPYTIRLVGRKVDSTVNLYLGDAIEFNNGTFDDSIYFWRVTGANYGSTVHVDDFAIGSSNADMVGTIPQTWYISRDVRNNENTGLYDEDGDPIYNSVFHATYSLYENDGTCTVSIDGGHQEQAIPQYVQNLTVQNRAGAYVQVPQLSGLVAFDLATFCDANEYGQHAVVVERGGVEIARSEFWYTGDPAQETEITFDRNVYAPYDSVQINTSIGDPYWLDGGSPYSYGGRLIDATTGLTKETWAIESQTDTHSTSVTTDLFPSSGQYYVELYATDANGDYLLAQDSAMVYNNKVVFDGYVFDAQQGTILSGATVSLTQDGTTYTDTTGSDGYFEFLDLAKDKLTQVSAAKSGYVAGWSNTTPTEYRRYTIQFALPPSAPAHSGEAVFGTVRSYPMGSFVESPAVRILHDGTQVNSTTGTAKGFFIFDGLNESETYTIEVEKAGYVDYSNAVSTGTGGSLTQIDPWLYPTYTLTVHLVDAVSMDPIAALMAVSVGGQSQQTTTGTATFENLQMGAASVAVVGSGYEANETPVSMTDDQEITLYVMPLAVVPTTDIPLTPTPTPALVRMIGTVYDGMTGTAITGATVEVTAEQGEVTRTDTTDGLGDYSIVNIQNGILTTVNATATGYTHTAFSFTPAGSAEYIVDIYMYRTDEATNPTIEPDPGLAGAGGTVLGGPYHELVETPTVVASNGTWSGPATLSPDHVWYFTDLEPDTAYNFTASASGYITQSVQATMGAAGSFTVVPIILDGVYDVTITIQDADTYALILQPVQLSLSNGQSGNTSTGSYTFTNLEYATYVVAATSEGYTGGGLSFLAYGDHTEYLYLAKAPEGSDSTYEYAIPPKPVEILCRNIFGMPLAGVTVTAQGGETTLPDRDLLGAFFGWGDKYSGADLTNASMTGTTSSDGGITFMMTDALKYNVAFTDPARGIDETVELMPHDTQYMFILGSMSATPAAGMPNMTLWADGAEGASPMLCGYYNDPAGTTSALYFVVEQINGTVRTEVNNQSLGAVQTASPSFAVNHTTGAMYSWGFRATTPDRGALQQWNGITLHSRLVELPIEESAYFWVSMCLVFLFAGLFSGNNIKYGFVAFPMFCGVLWYIGWLNIAGMTLGIVMVLGILMYLAKVQVA